MRDDKTFAFLSLGMIILLFIILILTFRGSDEEIIVQDLQYKNCVTEMQKAIPDPNDTEGRIDFLKDCQN
jgi:hypothetical protein